MYIYIYIYMYIYIYLYLYIFGFEVVSVVFERCVVHVDIQSVSATWCCWFLFTKPLSYSTPGLLFGAFSC